VSPAALGAPAPPLALRDQHGATVDLASYRGTAVAVVFYPYAFSRVCTGELDAIRDDLGSFQSSGSAVLAVSCDPVFSLRAYAESERLSFPLLSDFWPHGEVARAYGVFDEAAGCARRSTFVVDGAGVVRWSVHNPVGEARDPGALRTVLAGLRTPG
jgi:peroxiredoxin